MRHIYNPVKVTKAHAMQIEARILLSGLVMRNLDGPVSITGTNYTGSFFIHSARWSERSEDALYVSWALKGNPVPDFSELNTRFPLDKVRGHMRAIIELMVELQETGRMGVRLVDAGIVIENMVHYNSMMFFQVHDDEYSFNTYVPHHSLARYVRKHLMNKPQPDTLNIVVVEWAKRF